MNDLVSRSRASQRGFPCSESRLCILQERARHSKSSPHDYAGCTPFLMQYQLGDKRYFVGVAIVFAKLAGVVFFRRSIEYAIQSIIEFRYTL